MIDQYLRGMIVYYGAIYIRQKVLYVFDCLEDYFAKVRFVKTRIIMSELVAHYKKTIW